MSGQAFVVVPVNAGENGEDSYDHDQIASAIQTSLREKTAGQENDAGKDAEVTGPLSNIIGDNSDSVYKYINWENPMQTLGAFTAAMAILFGAHYIPLTQIVLKYAATALGAPS